MQLEKHRSSLLETLEGRTLFSGYGTYVYLETNNPSADQNAVLAYSENPATGALSPLAHFKYLTGGTGNRNAGPALGPDDSDKEVIASPDGKYLFAVNQGSNNISVFAIHPDGTLNLVHNAPVSSGGVEPVSLAFINDHLYVVNRGNSQLGTPGTVAPNVTSFFVGEDGTLFAQPNATVTLPLNLSTAQILASADGKFAFVDNFATPDNLKVSLADTIEPFVVNGDGSLTPVKNGTAGLPANPPLVLGLVEDPIHHIIYSGQAPAGGVATFTYSSTGKVSYVGSVASKGAATCWLNISPDGKFLYATDSASDAISVYSLANPLKPTLVQEFYLKGPTTLYTDRTATGPTSQDFQFSFDPTGKYIWLVNHTVDDNFQQGNQLHTLEVAANGTLSEANGPQFFPASLVTGLTHIQGIAVVTPQGYYDGSGAPVTALPQAQIAASLTNVFSDDSSGIQKLVDQLLDSAG
jgi:DNA-binding beta-propeller fold protein YncE